MKTNQLENNSTEQLNIIISIVGTGYVGLTTAVILANTGYKTYTIDVDEKKINTIKSGKSYFYEPGLDSLINRAITIGNLIPTTSYANSIPNSDVVFICVGTPSNDDGSVNLKYIFESISSVIDNAKSDLVLVQKSTVPVETAKKIEGLIKEKNRTDIKIDIISAPEFLRESSAVFDTLFFDRLVIGSRNEESANKIIEIYRNVDIFSKTIDHGQFTDYAFHNVSKKYLENLLPFENRVIRTKIESAELLKVTANSFLAMKISFANTVARICDKTGAVSKEVFDGIGMDPRIGRAFLYPGLGFSGGCFPKDVAGMIDTANDYDVRFGILEEVVNVNLGQINVAVNKIKQLIGNDLNGKKISILGLSFKPGTSDIRKSQSIRLIKRLINLGAIINAFDPKAIDEAKKELTNPSLNYVDSIENACSGVDCVVLATEWKEFIEFDYDSIRDLLNNKNILDCRNCLNKDKIEASGFNYLCF